MLTPPNGLLIERILGLTVGPFTTRAYTAAEMETLLNAARQDTGPSPLQDPFAGFTAAVDRAGIATDEPATMRLPSGRVVHGRRSKTAA